MVIYKATFPNNKIYIGKTKNFKKRKYEHKHRKLNTKMSKAIHKYGFECINWDILFESNDNTILNSKEKYFIEFYNSINNGYNISLDGGDTISKNENKINIIKKQLKSKGSNEYVELNLNLIENIKNDYIYNSLSIRKLNKKYKISEQRITRLLLSEKIVIDTDRCKLTNSKIFDNKYINLIINDYKNGLKIKDISKKENKSTMIISRILHDSGIRISSRFKNGKRYDGKQPKNK